MMLIEECNRQGFTPSAFIKAAMLDRLEESKLPLDKPLELTQHFEEKRDDKQPQRFGTPSKHEPELIKLMRLLSNKKSKKGQ